MKIGTSSVVTILAVLIGLTLGGYLFRDSQPRSFLAFDTCSNRCFKLNEQLGLLASVGIQQVPGLLPNVAAETDNVLAFSHPIPEYETHYIIVPKRDIRDVGYLPQEEPELISDIFAVIGELIRYNNLTNYRVITNGPEYQHVTYLHFHLIAGEKLR